MDGELHIIFGPMFSGKSTELIRRIRRFSVARKNCLLIKYINDVRYSDELACTHDRQAFAARASAKLLEIDNYEDYDVIGIDEGQFFPDIVEFAEMAAKQGKIVIVAALDGTFQRKPFGRVLELVPLAESVIKLNAVCMLCYKNAAFTRRLGTETDIEVIGGAEKYLAVCRQCYNTPHITHNKKNRTHSTQSDVQTVNVH